MDGSSSETTPTPTASAAPTSSSAGPTFLAQAQEPSQDPGQPSDKPPAPPRGDPPVEEPSKPAENGGDDGEGEGEQPLDEQAYAALKLGEGLVADEAALGDFRKLAAASKLPVETAQQILDLHGRMQEAAVRGWQAQIQDWRRATEADPFLAGHDVPNGGFVSIKDAKAAAGRFMSTYGDRELRQVLDQYGLGDHPALVRAVAKAGRDMASDRLHAGAGRPRVDPLRARYPSMSEDFFSH